MVFDEGDKKFIFEFSREFDRFLELYKEEKKRNANFISKLSHEIKNPLTIIKSSLQLLEKQIDGLGDNFYLESIYEEVNFIDDLLNQLSDYGKNEKRMNFEKISIGDLICKVVNSYKTVAERDKKVLQVDIEQPYQYIRCDTTSIRQVLSNLIKNALEATKDGDHIFVSVRALNGYTQIKISDTGVGIERERLSKIFEPFITTKSNGTGLGLAVVKSLVEAHSGKIEVDSILGEGTIFTITLPEYKKEK